MEFRFFFLLGAIRDRLRGLESETLYKSCGMYSSF